MAFTKKEVDEALASRAKRLAADTNPKKSLRPILGYLQFYATCFFISSILLVAIVALWDYGTLRPCEVFKIAVKRQMVSRSLTQKAQGSR